MVALRARAKHERRSLNAHILFELEERQRYLERGLTSEIKPGLYKTSSLRTQEERRALLEYHAKRLEGMRAGKPSPFRDEGEIDEIIREEQDRRADRALGIIEEEV